MKQSTESRGTSMRSKEQPDDYSFDYANILPDELLIKIFSLFKPGQLGKIALVCTRWHELSKAAVLWKSLVLGFKIPATTGRFKLCCDLLERYPLVHTLTIQAGIQFNEFWQTVSKLTSMKELEIGVSSGPSLNKQNVETIVSKCPNVEIMSLTFCPELDVTCLTHISKLSNLHTLTVIGCHNLTGDCIVAIANGCKKLRFLDLRLAQADAITDVAVCELAKCTYKTLEYLCLESNYTSDIGLSTLSKCTKLIHLEIVLGNLATNATLQAISTLPNLRLLGLACDNENNILDHDFQTFLQSRACLNLTELRLFSLDVLEDENVETITKTSWKKLRHLIMHHAFISDRGFTSILRNCTELESLHLVGMICVKGDFLVNFPVEAENLRSVSFFNCSVSQDMHTRLTTRLPKVKIQT